MAFLTEIKIKTVITFVPHILDRHFTTAIALNVFLDSLPRFHNQLYPVFISVASHLQILEGTSEVTILAQGEVVTVGTYETSPDDWAHVTTHAFVLIVSCQPICQQR